MDRPLRARILVLSDRAASGEREDRSGPALRDLMHQFGWKVVACEVLPDEFEQIRQRLLAWTEAEDCDLIVTCGGTGLAPRDVTPEATRAVIEREIPGLAELMRFEGWKKTRAAMLSRAVAGTRRGKVIVNLPGSVRGARESLEHIQELLPHAVDLAQGRTEHAE